MRLIRWVFQRKDGILSRNIYFSWYTHPKLVPAKSFFRLRWFFTMRKSWLMAHRVKDHAIISGQKKNALKCSLRRVWSKFAFYWNLNIEQIRRICRKWDFRDFRALWYFFRVYKPLKLLLKWIYLPWARKNKEKSCKKCIILH